MKINELDPQVEATLRTTAIALAALEIPPSSETLEKRIERLNQTSSQIMTQLVATWFEQMGMITKRRTEEVKA